MKTKLITLILLACTGFFFGQNRPIVNANSSEISDNLDLKAVASIFGDSQNLEDFERRLNDPKLQISNLDLNNDNQVDYLRVIESIENQVHLIIIQAVLGKDEYQDVASIEVQKDPFNKVQVQVVGNEYLYGKNYIYEPIYIQTPVFYDSFWVHNYRPYYSSWYWNYYPTYYYAWNPFPIFRYRHHIGLCINFNYQYNYVNYRRCQTAYNAYYGRRGNGYERLYPDNSFSYRHENVGNRYEYDQTRPRTRDVVYGNPRNTIENQINYGNNNPRNNISPRTNTNFENNSPRNFNSNENNTPRINSNSGNNTPRNYSTPRTDLPRTNSSFENNTPRPHSNSETVSPRINSGFQNSTPRNNSSPRSELPRASISMPNSAPRGNPSGGNNGGRGSGGRR